MTRTTIILCLVGIFVSLPLVWLSASAVFDGAIQSKERADCISMSQSITDTIDTIVSYYQDDARPYAEFNAQNRVAIEGQLATYRDERVLDLRKTWHPVDLYYWVQQDLETISALCPRSELERQTRELQELADNHSELATTSSHFVSEWDIQ